MLVGKAHGCSLVLPGVFCIGMGNDVPLFNNCCNIDFFHELGRRLFLDFVTKSNSDQTGENLKEFSCHIHANPYIQWVFPFLSLALSVYCLPFKVPSNNSLVHEAQKRVN